MEYTNEVWKPIKGYEGLYEISNLGRVKSLNYHRTGRPEIAKPYKTSKGYLLVGLWKDGKRKQSYVHQLVAQAFLEPVPGKDCIDHIDGNPENNVIELKEDSNGNLVVVSSNLRWCTKPENNGFPLARENNSKAHNRPEVKEKMSKALTNRRDQSKPVLQYTKSGEFLTEYPSIREAGRQTGINFRNISNCCIGKYKTGCGYIWIFAS